jgi:hypothetical protein
MAKLTRAEKSAINKAAWAEREPPPRKGGLTKAEMSELRREAWRMGKLLSDGRMVRLPDINAGFIGDLPPLPSLRD